MTSLSCLTWLAQMNLGEEVDAEDDPEDGDFKISEPHQKKKVKKKTTKRPRKTEVKKKPDRTFSCYACSWETDNFLELDLHRYNN